MRIAICDKYETDIEALAIKVQLDGLKKRCGTYSLGRKQKIRII